MNPQKDEYGSFHICEACKGKIRVGFGGYYGFGTFENPVYTHGLCICYHCLTDDSACFNPKSKFFRRKCPGFCQDYKKITDLKEYNKSQDFGVFEID